MPRLSIWVEELTVADQAWAFLGSKPNYTLVACLNVDAIHQVAPPPGFNALRVEWEEAKTSDVNGNQIPNRKPGASGHCGIANLNQGGKGDKNKRKALRVLLADIAEVSPVPVPHNIPHEHIQVAAYFVAEKTSCSGQPEDHWIVGIRQLRRDLVRQAKAQRSNQLAG